MCHGFLHLSSLVCLMEIMSGGFCFSDRDFATSPPITSFSFSEKEKEGKRKTAQGVPPRSEPRFAPANRDEIKIRGSMRLRPPRPPGERASRVRQTTEMLCTAEKVSVFGAKPVCSASRAARFRLSLPLEGKVPEGRMRCSAPARLCRQMLLFASLTGISRQRQSLPVFLSRFPVPTVTAVRAGRIGCHDFPRESGGNYGGRQREAGVI